jgi:hypothetical protein
LRHMTLAPARSVYDTVVSRLEERLALIDHICGQECRAVGPWAAAGKLFKPSSLLWPLVPVRCLLRERYHSSALAVSGRPTQQFAYAACIVLLTH